MKMPRLRVTKADFGWLMLAALTVVLQFWWLPGDGGNAADSFSSTMEGSRGLFETLSVLADDGFLPPVRREASRLVPETACTLLLLAPDRYPDDHEQEQLREFVQNGGSVVFAANWIFPNREQPEFRSRSFRFQLRYGAPDTHGFSRTPVAPAGGIPVSAPSTEPGQDPLEEDSPLLAESPEAEEAAAESSPIGGLTPAVPQAFELSEVQTRSSLVDGSLPWTSQAVVIDFPRDAEKLVIDSLGRTQAAAWRVGQGTFVVCATADLFSNRSMLFARQAAFAVRLVEYAGARTKGSTGLQEIVVSEYLNGAGSYHGASVMVSPLLRAGTLQLVLVALLLAWAGFHRFGPPLRERQNRRRSLTESAEAVGNLQYMANDGRTSVQQYLEWFSGEVRRRYGHSQLLEDPEQLAKKFGLDQEQVAQALADVRLSHGRKSVAPAEAAVAIRRLARIHQKVFSSVSPPASDF